MSGLALCGVSPPEILLLVDTVREYFSRLIKKQDFSIR
jgi:hypothetical protein